MNITSDKERAPAIQERLAEASYEELLGELECRKVLSKCVRADIAWLHAEIAQRELDGDN